MIYVRAGFVSTHKIFSGDLNKYLGETMKVSVSLEYIVGEKSERHSGRLILTHIFALNPVWSEETHVKSTKSCLLPV